MLFESRCGLVGLHVHLALQGKTPWPVLPRVGRETQFERIDLLSDTVQRVQMDHWSCPKVTCDECDCGQGASLTTPIVRSYPRY